MSDFKDLYRNAIVDHYKKPRNYHTIEQANRKAEGNNPLCGDKFSIFLQIDNGVISDIGFIGVGCAIATASASMMTESLRGKTETEARVLLAQFTDLLTGGSDSREAASLGNLSVFKDVRGYPARVKCALLAWNILLSALDENQETVETE
jgi:nitrogen fixation NifU-like protein